MNASDFAAENGITVGLIASTGVDRRVRVELHRPGSLGFVGLIEWNEPGMPNIADILTALADTAADIETAIDAEEWARYVGIRADRMLEEKYRVAKDQARRLEQWLPVGAYETLMWDLTQK